MVMMIESIVGILGIATAGSLTWAYNLGTKVATLEKSENDFRDFMDQLLDAKFEPIYQRLDRIERSMNGNLK